MPVTLVDRLPLPNLKVYTAGSVLLLSVAVYYAVSVTNDPNWRTNTTLQRQEAAVVGSDVESVNSPPTVLAPVYAANHTRNLTEQVVEVMTFMMQEPLCMWSVINMAYCSLAVAGLAVQRLVFGTLRVSEAQRVKDKFWNYVFYKFIFVFGVVNVQYMDEVLLWCSWFTLLGCLHLLAQLCKDRFEYLSSSPQTARWAHARLLVLLVGILCAAAALMVAAVRWGLPAGRDTFAFMAAECALVCVPTLHVVARSVLRARDADAAGPAAYYTHLVFDSVALVTELAHVAHMVVHSNALVSMASLVLLMQLRHLLHALLARLRRHRLYTALADHMSRNYPMASKEEVEKNEDNCAICWEPMKEARKLPCAHLFHNSCLCRWVQQDASCPTCRRALSAAAPPAATLPPLPQLPHLPHLPPLAPLPPLPPLPADPADPAHPAPQPNHFFHFDGSRYVSWLPSFSVEVTRVRAPAALPDASQLDAMARQVQQVFPQFTLSALASDLAQTLSPDLTVDNILAGRLLPRQHLEEPTTSVNTSVIPDTATNVTSDNTTPTTSTNNSSTSSDSLDAGSSTTELASQHDEQSLKFALSLPDNSIEVYELNNTSLRHICRLSGHEKTLTEVVLSPKEDNILYSAGEDGIVKMWDTRTSGICVQDYKDEEEEMIRPYECMDVSHNGRVLCAGSQLVEDDAYLVFWDQRVTKPLGGYWNSHTDDITQVKFHKEKMEILATGSVDGLLNVFDITEQTEDDALTFSMNVENSVDKISWLDENTAACITQSNDLQVWNMDSGDLIKSYDREKIARSIKRSRADDCYLVDAFTSIDDAPALLAGSYGGTQDTLRSVTLAERRLLPRTNFSGNKQIVRCCWYDKDKDILVTTGESGLLSVWSGQGASENDYSTLKLTNSLRNLHANRHKPY